MRYIYDGLPTALCASSAWLDKASFPSVLVPLARAESNFAPATASLLLGALKCGELSGSGSYGQFGLVALLAYAGLAVTGWLVVLACRCLASLVDCVAERNERGLELV